MEWVLAGIHRASFQKDKKYVSVASIIRAVLENFVGKFNRNGKRIGNGSVEILFPPMDPWTERSPLKNQRGVVGHMYYTSQHPHDHVSSSAHAVAPAASDSVAHTTSESVASQDQILRQPEFRARVVPWIPVAAVAVFLYMAARRS